MNFSTMLKRPSAFVPVLMSLAALGVVASALTLFGIPPSGTDEGTAAHLWQMLMAGQLPVIAFFAVRWLPRSPWPAAQVLALQVCAGLAAMAPVYLLHL